MLSPYCLLERLAVYSYRQACCTANNDYVAVLNTQIEHIVSNESLLKAYLNKQVRYTIKHDLIALSKRKAVLASPSLTFLQKTSYLLIHIAKAAALWKRTVSGDLVAPVPAFRGKIRKFFVTNGVVRCRPPEFVVCDYVEVPVIPARLTLGLKDIAHMTYLAIKSGSYGTPLYHAMYVYLDRNMPESLECFAYEDVGSIITQVLIQACKARNISVQGYISASPAGKAQVFFEAITNQAVNTNLLHLESDFLSLGFKPPKLLNYEPNCFSQHKSKDFDKYDYVAVVFPFFYQDDPALYEYIERLEVSLPNIDKHLIISIHPQNKPHQELVSRLLYSSKLTSWELRGAEISDHQFISQSLYVIGATSSLQTLAAAYGKNYYTTNIRP